MYDSSSKIIYKALLRKSIGEMFKTCNIINRNLKIIYIKYKNKKKLKIKIYLVRSVMPKQISHNQG